MEKYLFVTGTLVLTIYGQLIAKARAHFHAAQIAPGDYVGFVIAMFLDPWVLSAIAAAVLAGVSWMLAIRNAELSLLYPFVALTFVFVPLFAALLFGERIGLVQAIGLAMIVCGVSLTTIGQG
jgi:drug/metabolite transporter (DMT)-like permease